MKSNEPGQPIAAQRRYAMSSESRYPNIPANEHAQNPGRGPSPQPVRCANCDIDFLWQPTVVQGKSYCCTGCAAGGPCTCDYSQYRSTTIKGVIHYGSGSPT